jgi:hypothetical protein
MQTMKAFFFTLAATVLLGGTCAQAQGNPSKTAYKNLDIVTQSEPTVRQRCRVLSTDNEKTVCKLAFGQTRTYQRSELIALIVPREHAHMNVQLLKSLGWMGLAVSAQSAAIYGALVVSSVIATAGLSVVALLLVPTVVVAMMMVAESKGGSQVSHDAVIYESPDTPLTVALR